jgi:RsiW-degrading membrane proteinase PrsW (M82 family)
MISLRTIIEAVLGGLLPALVWLWFWLKEDKLHHETKRVVLITFLLGMMSVLLALPIESFVAGFVVNNSLLAFLLWATTEECCKFLAFKISKSITKAVNDPIDPFIGMVTAALGFAALENMLFLFAPLSQSGLIIGFITGNMRFVGANLLHLTASGLVGIFLGFSYYKKKSVRFGYALLGLVLAALLHTLFNFFILYNEGASAFLVFSVLWVFVIIIIGLCEKIKQVKLQRIEKAN